MEEKTLKIGLASVLIYFLSVNIYDLLVRIFFWTDLEYTFSNNILSILIITLIAIFSLYLLYFSYNKFLMNNVSLNDVFRLIGLNLILYGISAGVWFFYQKSLQHIDFSLENNDLRYFQFTFSEWAELSIPFFGILYFLWRLKFRSNTVANNG